ncbi:unnamed protein product [Effrenium voratum]|nr:unnamed protein product [Effrenium voratum]
MEVRPGTGASLASRSSVSRRSGQSVGSRHSRVSVSCSVTSEASQVDLMRVPPRTRQPPDGSCLTQTGSFSLTGLPGYTGYVPAKVAENVHALTFQKANERANAEGQMVRSGRLVPSVKGRTFDGPAPGAEIPGYTGFIPGRYANNVIGSTYAKSAELAFLVKNQQMAERLHRVQCYRRGEHP